MLDVSQSKNISDLLQRINLKTKTVFMMSVLHHNVIGMITFYKLIFNMILPSFDFII